MRDSMAGMSKEAGEAARLAIGTFSRGPPRRRMAIEEYAVDWNGPSTAPPPRLRLLLLADVDLASAGRIVEWAIQGGKAFDLCAVCGDFVPRPEGWSPDGETEEQLSAEEGEMSSTLAQLENTVCRVMYVPGPLDPVIPSIRLPRTRNAAAVPTTASRPSPGAAAAPSADAGCEAERRVGQRDVGKERVLQLTPTSKNVLRRNLRLAPGLSAAGFSEDPNQCPGTAVDRGGDGEDGGTGDDTRDDQTFAALKSLSRSGGGKAAPVSQESVILLSRLGGPRRSGGAGSRAGGTTAATPPPPVSNNNSNPDALSVAEIAAGLTELEDEEAATAARLRRLWAEQAMAVGPESEPRGLDGSGGGGGRGLLLHACAGPGTFLAVRQALEEGEAEPVGGGGAGGDGDCTGVGCRVGGGTTVAALGSLRQHGAYCVVELGMPTTMPPGRRSGNGGSGAKGGWSVASVAFGRVEAVDGDPEAEREKLARRATGSFVLNFD